MIFKWSGDDEDQLPVPVPPLPTFETQQEVPEPQPQQQHEEEQGPIELPESEYEVVEEEIEVEGEEYPDAPVPEVPALTPGIAEGKSLESIIAQYQGANAQLQAKRAATIAMADPRAYYTSHRDPKFIANRFYDPITAWVLDNKVLTDPYLTIDWLQTQNKRKDIEYNPYIFKAAEILYQSNPMLLVNAENLWHSNRVGRVIQPLLSWIWEAALRITPSNEQGRLFIDDASLRHFQALGREIGERGNSSTFQARVAPVLKNMINIRLKELSEDTSRTPEEKATDKKTLKQWAAQINRINRNINMKKQSALRSLLSLAKIATVLDVKGEHELASELDSILSEAADPKLFVDKRPEEERKKDRTDPTRSIC